MKKEPHHRKFYYHDGIKGLISKEPDVCITNSKKAQKKPTNHNKRVYGLSI